MLVLDNTDVLEGGASVASVVDYTFHGVVGSVITQLAAGTLSDTLNAVLYTAGDIVVVTAITLVNTHSAAVNITLRLDPANGGNPRYIIPETMSLGIGFSLHTDGVKLSVFNASGQLETSVTAAAPTAHKDSHDPEDGSDPLDTAAAAEISVVVAAGAGTSHSLARADHIHAINHSIANNHIVTVDDASAADNDYGRFTADGLEGVPVATVKTDLGIDYDTIWIPASAMVPTTTNGAASGSNEYATNDNMFDYLAFDTTTEEFAAFSLPMPEDWDRSTIKAKFYWTPGTATGAADDTVEWQLAGQAISNDDPLDVAMGDAGEVISDTVLAGENGDLHISDATPAITIGGTPALADLVHFKASRNVGGTDDHGYDAWLLGILIQYKKTNVVAAW